MPITIIPDTGVNNVYVNENTGLNIILSGVSEQNSINISGAGGAITPHNNLNGIQGGQFGQYYHLTSGEYANLATGDYYLNSNPSGYITGIDLSNYSTIFFSTGISGHLQGQISVLDNNTGFYYLNNNPSGYITGVDLSAYVTGSVIRPSDTGAFYAASNPSGFITGVDLSSYVTGDVVRPSDTGIFYTINNPSGYITGIDLSPYALQSSLTGTSGHLQGQITTLDSLTGTYYQNSNPAGYITGVDLSGYVTGDVVRPSDTGQFYPASNPSGYITGIDQISFSTLLPTGIEETGILFPYSFSGVPRVFADLALISDTGYLVGTKNITNTGYTAVFSDIIEETGLYLQTLATNI